MVKQIAAVGLAVALQMAVPWQARAATTPSGVSLAAAQMSMPMAGTSSGSQAPGTSVGKSVAIGTGAVIGYTLMLNPVGSAVMGAAMGAMLAVTVYETYWAPEAPARLK